MDTLLDRHAGYGCARVEGWLRMTQAETMHANGCGSQWEGIPRLGKTEEEGETTERCQGAFPDTVTMQSSHWSGEDNRPASRLAATLLRADEVAADSSGLGQAANEAHCAGMLRMPAEALECILICEIYDDQCMTIGWSIVGAVAYTLYAGDAYEEPVGFAQRLVDNFAAHSQLDPKDNFMPNHSVIRHLLLHATPATSDVYQHTITHMAVAAQKTESLAT